MTSGSEGVSSEGISEVEVSHSVIAVSRKAASTCAEANYLFPRMSKTLREYKQLVPGLIRA